MSWIIIRMSQHDISISESEWAEILKWATDNNHVKLTPCKVCGQEASHNVVSENKTIHLCGGCFGLLFS
jgi:hypothetical protein